jgi:general stress protein 26
MSASRNLSRDEAFMYLKTLATAVLSTVSSDGKPSAAIIYFVVDERLNFYFLSKSDTTKAKNLKENHNAALTIIEFNSPRTIQAVGIVKEVERPEIYNELMTKISDENMENNKSLWPPPVHKLHKAGSLILYMFTPSWLRLADFSEASSEQIFQTIIPETS